MFIVVLLNSLFSTIFSRSHKQKNGPNVQAAALKAPLACLHLHILGAGLAGYHQCCTSMKGMVLGVWSGKATMARTWRSGRMSGRRSGTSGRSGRRAHLYGGASGGVGRGGWVLAGGVEGVARPLGGVRVVLLVQDQLIPGHGLPPGLLPRDLREVEPLVLGRVLAV